MTYVYLALLINEVNQPCHKFITLKQWQIYICDKVECDGVFVVVVDVVVLMATARVGE